MLLKLNIDGLPAAEELQVKVVSLNDGKVKVHLPSERTFQRLVGDNIDHETHARIQSKEHTNRSIHWTHQYAKS